MPKDKIIPEFKVVDYKGVNVEFSILTNGVYGLGSEIFEDGAVELSGYAVVMLFNGFQGRICVQRDQSGSWTTELSLSPADEPGESVSAEEWPYLLGIDKVASWFKDDLPDDVDGPAFWEGKVQWLDKDYLDLCVRKTQDFAARLQRLK